MEIENNYYKSIFSMKKELMSMGLIGRLKTWLLMKICGDERIQTQVAFAKGIMSDKYSFFREGGNDVLWLNPNDIECFWDEAPRRPKSLHDRDFNDPAKNKTRYFIRTKSGKDFAVTRESWYKVMHGVDYTEPNE